MAPLNVAPAGWTPAAREATILGLKKNKAGRAAAAHFHLQQPCGVAGLLLLECFQMRWTNPAQVTTLEAVALSESIAARFKALESDCLVDSELT